MATIFRVNGMKVVYSRIFYETTATRKMAYRQIKVYDRRGNLQSEGRMYHGDARVLRRCMRRGYP